MPQALWDTATLAIQNRPFEPPQPPPPQPSPPQPLPYSEDERTAAARDLFARAAAKASYA